MAERTWHKEPPTEPGWYPWRRSWQWEDVLREVPEDRMTFSHRYEQRVPLEKVGGEWLY